MASRPLPLLLLALLHAVDQKCVPSSKVFDWKWTEDQSPGPADEDGLVDVFPEQCRLNCSCLSGAWAACSNVSAASSALDTLLAEYAPSSAPAAPVRVRAALDVRHARVDERASTLRLLADLRLRWEDSRLSWNETEWECDSMLVPAERLWLPDVELLNGAAGAGAGDGSLRARLSADSEVLWITRLDVAVPLAIDLRDWPSDSQASVFTFGSREHSADEIMLEIDDFKYATVWEAGSWEIESVAGEKVSLGEGRPVVRWTVVLRRRAAAHAMAGASVLAAAVLLLIGAALLPPAQRPALCACAAFTAALWLISALLRLPGSATCPRTLPAMAGVCGAAGAWCACAALLARLARCSRPPPPPLRALLAAAPAWSVSTEPAQESSSASATWAAAAQLLDSALRAALALLLLVLVCLAL